MILNKKIIRFSLILSSCFIGDMTATFSLVRVVPPTKVSIDQERALLQSREIKRSVIKYGTIAGTLVLLYAALTINKSMESLEKRLDSVEAKVPQNDNQKPGVVISNEPNGQFSSLSKLKDIAQHGFDCAKTTVKYIFNTAPMVISGALLNHMGGLFSQHLAEFSKQESILWYIEHHTQLWQLSDAIKLACIPYDLHSGLLCLDQVNCASQEQLKALSQDIFNVLNNKNDSGCDDFYIEHWKKKLKRSYEKKNDELTQLQNYIIPHIAQKRRVDDLGFRQANLFESEEIAKQKIVDLCSLFSQQIQKIVNFAMMHIDYKRDNLPLDMVMQGENRIKQMIFISNNYFDTMEKLLNASLLDLEAMSKINKGLFTCSYEFEKLLKEYVTTIHRYCSQLA
ncbi:hypothetical protein HYV11_02040 [Candidatus Dependentiae bacterium]|nr:hypothetical protein [Candidatus Dependentiae bacterium]